MDIEMKWAPANAALDQKGQSDVLDREVERFSQWLTKLPDTRANGALNNPERALLKTYLVQKLNGKLDEVK